jgi:hypothetical protein
MVDELGTLRFEDLLDLSLREVGFMDGLHYLRNILLNRLVFGLVMLMGDLRYVGIEVG